MNKKIKMRLRSYDHPALDRVSAEIIETARSTGARTRGPIPFPRKIHRFILLRSPHIDKKARDQFERRTYNRLIEIDCTSQTLAALMDLTVASEVEVEIKV